MSTNSTSIGMHDVSEQAYKKWFARILWADPYNKKSEVVSLTRIRKFRPQSTTDYDAYKHYRVKGKKEDFKDGQAHSGWALIGFIGGAFGLCGLCRVRLCCLLVSCML